MEAVGLAVGVVGLAGLFSACLDVLDKAQAYKAAVSDSHALDVQFEAQATRFRKWGQEIGLESGKLSTNTRHSALADHKTKACAERILTIILELFQSGDPTPAKLLTSKRKKLAWALIGKEKYEDKTDLLAKLVQCLYELVPLESQLQGTRPDHSEYIERLLDDVKSLVGVIKADRAKTEVEEHSRLRKELESWLVGSCSSSDLFYNSSQKRLNSTCDWILGKPDFMHWLSGDTSSSSSRLLWINGRAGFGKTILFSRIVEYLRGRGGALVPYFFFSSDYESHRHPLTAVRSWISQVMRQDETTFERVYHTWLNREHEERAPGYVIETLFREMIRTIPSCIFAIDGLDECKVNNDPYTTISDLMKEAVKSPKNRVLIMSRTEPDIRQALKEGDRYDFIDYRITVDDVRADITKYSKRVIAQRLPNKPEAFKAEFSDTMTEHCEGQFLWVALQADRLRKGMSQAQLQRSLSETPRGLTDIYERDWQHILQYHLSERNRTFSLLRWATFSLRPLRVDEITEAVLIDDGATSLPIEEFPDAIDESYVETEILGLCGSLLEIRESYYGNDSDDRAEHSNKGFSINSYVSDDKDIKSMIVHITHFSVKQFLIHKFASLEMHFGANIDLNSSYEISQHTLLAKKCIQYIAFPQTWEFTNETVYPRLGTNFRDYAQYSFIKHTFLGNENDFELWEAVNNFFDSPAEIWGAFSVAFFSRFFPDSQKKTSKTPPRPIHFAALLRLGNTVKHLLAKPCTNINDRTDAGSTPLFLSCLGGNYSTAEILLESGAKLSIGDYSGKKPIHIAANRDDTKLVLLLLRHGACPNEPDSDNLTPLSIAVRYGNLGVVQALLDNGASVDIPICHGWSMIHLAIASPNVEVAQLLLQRGANIEAQDDKGSTALNIATNEGHIEFVQLLLQNGANIEARTINGFTPLCAAIDHGHLKLIELLLQKGANVEAPGSCNTTPLYIAAEKGNFEVVDLLLQNGASTETRSISDTVPLHVATLNGHPEVVDLLLQKGAKIECQTAGGFTPLYIAARQGDIGLSSLLLQRGANAEASDDDGLTPLHVAAFKGYFELADLLLQKGANIDAQDANGLTALHAVAHTGNLRSCRFLLQKGANIDAQNTEGYTPLHFTAYTGSLELSSFLLQQGANTETQTAQGHMPLHIAAYKGNFAVFSLLLPLLLNRFDIGTQTAEDLAAFMSQLARETLNL